VPFRDHETGIPERRARVETRMVLGNVGSRLTNLIQVGQQHAYLLAYTQKPTLMVWASRLGALGENSPLPVIFSHSGTNRRKFHRGRRQASAAPRCPYLSQSRTTDKRSVTGSFLAAGIMILDENERITMQLYTLVSTA